MKSQAECWEAILEGKTLVNVEGFDVKLVNGMALNMDGTSFSFSVPAKWRVKEKQGDELKECTPKENVNLFRKGQVYTYYVEKEKENFFFVKVEGRPYRSDAFLRDFYTDDFNLNKAKRKKPKYCRFKHNIDEDCLAVSIYFVVGSEQYENKKSIGWTECAHKTFEEIE